MADTVPNQTNQGALDVLIADKLTAQPSTSAKPLSITNQSVLNDMQKLYEQKLAEKNYFLQDLADAAAWWSGGAAGPSTGLALRAQTRANQAKQLEDLQAALSQGRVSIAQLEEAGSVMGAPSTNTATSLNGQPTSPTTPSAGYTIRGVPVPESVWKAYDMWRKGGNLAKANAVFEDYVKESTKGEIGFATNPSAYKQDEYYDDRTGQITGKNPMQIRNMGAPTAQPSSAAPVTKPSVTAPSSAPTTTTEPAVSKTSDQNDIYRFENLSDNAKQRLRAAYEKQGLQNNLMDRADVAELFNKAPMENRKAAFLQAGETPKVESTSAQLTSGRIVPSYSQAKAIASGEKSFQEKSQTEAGKAAGVRQGAFESAAVDAGKDLQNANVMINILDKHPDAVGLGYKNRALGATIEGVKLLTGKDIEPFARRASLSNEAIEAGNKFDALAETNNLKFRQAVMKGTGQVSDFETKLTERASGLSKDNSLEANRFFATVAAENYRTLNKLGVEWQKYQQANPGAVFSQFEQSEVWKKAQAERENRLKTYFPEIERGDLAFGNRAPKEGAGDAEMETWRKTYGKQKGNQ